MAKEGDTEQRGTPWKWRHTHIFMFDISVLLALNHYRQLPRGNTMPHGPVGACNSVYRLSDLYIA